MARAHLTEIVVCVVAPAGDAAGAADGPSLGDLDLRAVELGRRLARSAGARATAVAVGQPEAASRMLAECLARGIDALVRVEADEVDDDHVLAACLAEALGPVAPDLIICGQRSAAGAHGVVPAALAHRLGLPMVSNVVALDVDWARRQARATQMLERGARWNWDSALPMVCAVEREVAAPRYLALRRYARASALGTMTPLDPHLSDAVAEIERDFGALTVESRGPARIRPKKSKAPPKAMKAADRMKFLRGGGPPKADAASSDDGPRKLIGSPEESAREILALLENEELI